MKVSELYRKLLKVHVDGPDEEIGGGLPAWFQSGSGSPVGTVTPSQKGALYQDTTNGALYTALDMTDADWIQVGGAGQYAVFVAGPMLDKTYGALFLQPPEAADQSIVMRTLAAYNGDPGGAEIDVVENVGAGGHVDMSVYGPNDEFGQFRVDFDKIRVPPVQGSLCFVADVPDNSFGADLEWCFSYNGHIYFKTGGSWVQKV